MQILIHLILETTALDSFTTENIKDQRQTTQKSLYALHPKKARYYIEKLYISCSLDAMR